MYFFSFLELDMSVQSDMGHHTLAPELWSESAEATAPIMNDCYHHILGNTLKSNAESMSAQYLDM